jgi:hypothetical protein
MRLRGRLFYYSSAAVIGAADGLAAHAAFLGAFVLGQVVIKPGVAGK